MDPPIRMWESRGDAIAALQKIHAGLATRTYNAAKILAEDLSLFAVSRPAVVVGDLDVLTLDRTTGVIKRTLLGRPHKSVFRILSARERLRLFVRRTRIGRVRDSPQICHHRLDLGHG